MIDRDRLRASVPLPTDPTPSARTARRERACLRSETRCGSFRCRSSGADGRRGGSACSSCRRKVRPALDHLAGDAELGLSRVKALLERPAPRVGRHAAGLVGPSGMAIDVPVGRPLPDVAGHVEETVAVRWKGPDLGGGAVAGLGSPRKVAVPVVGEPLPRCFRMVAPGVRGAVKPTPGGELPFGLGRQGLAFPIRRTRARPRMRRALLGDRREQRVRRRGRQDAASLRQGSTSTIAIGGADRPGPGSG